MSRALCRAISLKLVLGRVLVYRLVARVALASYFASTRLVVIEPGERLS